MALKRTKPMRRARPQTPRKPLARKSPMRKRPRPMSATLRIYGPVERRAWMRRRVCVVDDGWCDEPVQGHHIETDGTGRKADAHLIVPLCGLHHRSLHRHGRATFCTLNNIDLAACAASTEAAWLAYSQQETK